MTTKEDKQGKQAVAKTENNAVATIDEEFDALIEEDAGAGQEYMGADDFAIPRIGIIQSLSPQRNKQKAEYIEDAEEGQIFESVSKTLWDGNKGIVVIPCQYQGVYLEWADRSNGGGLVTNHGRDSSKYDETPPNDKGQRITEEGNIITPTAEYYVLIVDEDTGETSQAVLSMANTQRRQAKLWNSQINKIKHKSEKTGKYYNTPIFYSTWLLRTVPESNNKGSWFRWEIKPVKPVKDMENGRALYEEAKSFREAVNRGMVKTPEYEADNSVEVESDEDPM